MALSPTVRRRRLAAELRQIRESRGLSGDRVAEALAWSPSKISRIESGRTTPKPADVDRLLGYYGIGGPERARLASLAHDARQKGWWDEYAGDLPAEFIDAIGLESEASEILEWQPYVVPGLLQTEDYARHIMLGYQRVVPITPQAVERRVQVRMRRQLRRLAELADLPNVELRILPLSADRTVAPGDSFVVLNYGALNGEALLPDVVIAENLPKSELYFESDDEGYLYRRVFDSQYEKSLGPGESRDLIERIARSAWA